MTRSLWVNVTMSVISPSDGPWQTLETEKTTASYIFSASSSPIRFNLSLYLSVCLSRSAPHTQHTCAHTYTHTHTHTHTHRDAHNFVKRKVLSLPFTRLSVPSWINGLLQRYLVSYNIERKKKKNKSRWYLICKWYKNGLFWIRFIISCNCITMILTQQIYHQEHSF